MWVAPVRDKRVFQSIVDYLLKTNERDAAMFALGCYTGMRFGDIRKLRINDIRGVSILRFVEEKTGKLREISLRNKFLSEILLDYCADKPGMDMFLKSREGVNGAITRQAAIGILKDVCRRFGITENIGTHTMRKTFAFHFYVKTGDIAFLMDLLNHSSIDETLCYIGIKQEQVNRAYVEFDI